MDDKIENIEKEITYKKNNEYAIKAKEYINRILYGVQCYHGYNARPTIVMSMDIFDILVAFTTNTIKYNRNNNITCCGYNTKIAFGHNVLYIAYDLMEIL